MVRYVFTPDEIGRELIETDKRIRVAVVRGLRLAARLGETEVKREIAGNEPFPVVDTGELLRSVHTRRTPDGAELLIDAPHADYQEYGTGPQAGRPQYTPPFEAIEAWALRKQRGLRQRQRTTRKAKSGAGEPVSRRRDRPAASASQAGRVIHRRRQTKAARAVAKGARRAAARTAKTMAGAVWQQIRRFGVRPKRYFRRASTQFADQVQEQVARQVARVKE